MGLSASLMFRLLVHPCSIQVFGRVITYSCDLLKPLLWILCTRRHLPHVHLCWLCFIIPFILALGDVIKNKNKHTTWSVAECRWSIVHAGLHHILVQMCSVEYLLQMHAILKVKSTKSKNNFNLIPRCKFWAVFCSLHPELTEQTELTIPSLSLTLRDYIMILYLELFAAQCDKVLNKENSG